MPIMTDAGFAADDWVTLPADLETVDAVSGKAIAPFSLFDQHWDALRGKVDQLGAAISNDADLATLAPYLENLDLIALVFPSFADGRAFSQARRLRATGFMGTLRATGKLVADQYAYARACGFDEVSVDEAIAARQPEAQWRAMGDSLSLSYQNGYAGGRNILDARRQARATMAVAAE